MQEERQLFGGAITINLPSSFKDVSEMRPVPDHQEIFCDTSSDHSLSVEIVEMGPPDDVAAFYLRDWMELNDASAAASDASHAEATIDSSHLTESISSQCNAYYSSSQVLVAGATKVLVRLAVLRLERVASDLLITHNIPQSDQLQGTIASADSLLLKAISTLAVKDWSLFESND